MSDVVKPQRAKMWKEGLRLFRQNWREWAKQAVWSCVVIAICQGIMMMTLSDDTAGSEAMKGVAEAQKAKQGLTPAQDADIKKLIMECLEWAVPFAIVFIVQTYAFIVFFMKKQGGFATPKASVGGFFRWIWVYIQIFLLLIAVAVVVVGVPMGLEFLPHAPIPTPVAVLAAMAGYVFLYFIMLRLTPVIVLGVCDVKPLFQTSWAITKGNCWRLFGNILLLILIIMGFAIVMGIMEGIATASVMGVLAATKTAAISASGDSLPPVAVVIQSVLGAINLTIFNGITWAFYCAATHVLYDEKRQTDPAFVLTAPTPTNQI